MCSTVISLTIGNLEVASKKETNQLQNKHIFGIRALRGVQEMLRLKVIVLRLSNGQRILWNISDVRDGT